MARTKVNDSPVPSAKSPLKICPTSCLLSLGEAQAMILTRTHAISSIPVISKSLVCLKKHK
jgi:hypothetical protein